MMIPISHEQFIDRCIEILKQIHPTKRFLKPDWRTKPIPDFFSDDFEICGEVGYILEHNPFARVNELFKFYKIVYWFQYPELEGKTMIPFFSVWKFMRHDQVLKELEENKDLVNPAVVLKAYNDKRTREIIDSFTYAMKKEEGQR